MVSPELLDAPIFFLDNSDSLQEMHGFFVFHQFNCWALLEGCFTVLQPQKCKICSSFFYQHDSSSSGKGKLLLLSLVFGVQSSAVVLASAYGLHSPRVQKHGERQGGALWPLVSSWYPLVN